MRVCVYMYHLFNIVLGLAYAVLANLDPVYGLYTAIVPVIVYSIFGTSRHVSIGRRKRINLNVLILVKGCLMFLS